MATDHEKVNQLEALLRDASRYVDVCSDPPTFFRLSDGLPAEFVEDARAVRERIDAALKGRPV